MISGAGSGGFIGINNSAGNLTPESIQLFLDGGGMPNDLCSSFGGMPGNTTGEKGLVSPLFPCVAGHGGEFCQKCPLGTWSRGNSTTCQACTNKPRRNAYYNETGWSNPICKYKCTRAVPLVVVNPDCLDAIPFFVRFFRGAGGVTAIFGCLVVLVSFLLWRRAGKGKRDAAESDMQKRPGTLAGNTDDAIGVSMRNHARAPTSCSPRANCPTMYAAS
eukprot:CAMPEP_0172841052 /NCGR_PEP_ID=MMETSP1075-20121228/29749_1 /TAXON_ID=2916 /ORGANISM="Ceratium fusus, Strain PA161109" /LENGTH=217 /DNA_ID=CAMNT_0013684985 /DNA_START=75 /DNA_END=726 /DNA_ORIENTATION=+